MISTHVPSLELCKKLRDLGWKKETIFWWGRLKRKRVWILFCVDCDEGENLMDIIPAPTVGEMMEWLPDDVEFSLCKQDGSYRVSSRITKGFLYDKSYANCLALMLIHLIEIGVVKLEEKE